MSFVVRASLCNIIFLFFICSFVFWAAADIKYYCLQQHKILAARWLCLLYMTCVWVCWFSLLLAASSIRGGEKEKELYRKYYAAVAIGDSACITKSKKKRRIIIHSNYNHNLLWTKSAENLLSTQNCFSRSSR